MQPLKIISIIPAAIWRAFWRQSEELALYLAIQAVLLLAALIALKWAGVAHAYAGSGLAAQLSVLFAVCAYDFLLAGGIGLLAWMLRFGPSPRPWLRKALLAGMQLLFAGWLIISIVNLETYKSLGSPLSYNLLLLAPNTAPRLLSSAIGEKASALIVEACLTLALALLSPVAFGLMRPQSAQSAEPGGRKGGWSHVRPALAPLLMLAAGFFSYAMPVSGARAAALRRLSVLSIFALESNAAPADLPPATPAETKALQALCGPDRSDGKQAFAPLAPGKYNVVLFVWESVGARFLKSYHPSGIASTPNLDALYKSGGVYFSHCYAESPLSAQSAWSLLMGISPPARPVIFTYGDSLPPYAATLPGELKRAGFETAAFCSCNHEVAAIYRILDACGFAVSEDCRTLQNRNRFANNDQGTEDAAIVERTLQWIDGLPRGKPFFTLLWNVETHYPYRWNGMPRDIADAGALERFAACIEHTDGHIEKLYQGLAQRGLDKNTIFIVVGDHGEGMGRAPRPYDRGHSMLVYEEAIHVPLFFIHPQLPSRTVEMTCKLADIFPTLMACEGLPPPAGVDGHSLAGIYPSQPLFARSIVWWPLAAIAGSFKLVLNEPGGTPELFNLAADPSETTDIAETDAETTTALMRALIRYSCDRFKNDASFDYGFQFLPTGNRRNPARPNINDLLIKK